MKILLSSYITRHLLREAHCYTLTIPYYHVIAAIIRLRLRLSRQAVIATYIVDITLHIILLYHTHIVLRRHAIIFTRAYIGE